MFSEDSSHARSLYRKYMGQEVTISGENLYKTVDQQILGNERFVELVVKKVKGGLIRSI